MSLITESDEQLNLFTASLIIPAFEFPYFVDGETNPIC